MKNEKVMVMMMMIMMAKQISRKQNVWILMISSTMKHKRMKMIIMQHQSKLRDATMLDYI